MLVDPFCLYVIALDELWAQAEGVMKDIGNVFGTMERYALDLAGRTTLHSDQHDFVGLHNLAKHIIHLREGADAILSTAQRLVDHHEQLVIEDPKNKTKRLVHQRLKQKLVQFEVWTFQVSSLKQRMSNVINLSFNVVTQRDSNILKNDSQAMRALATVTVAFLPVATVAAIFGSQFFNSDPTNRKIYLTNDFWIFWVLTTPLGILVCALYYWLSYSHEKKVTIRRE
ncbi:MAG: hypothetical protein Q9217_004722 [Psora testacea]